MRDGWRSFWVTVAGTVVGGVILAIVLATGAKLAGLLPTIWSGIAYPVPVPAIFVVLVVVGVAVFARRGYARARAIRRDTAPQPAPPPVPPPPPLSDDEKKVVAVLAALDGGRLDIARLAFNCRRSKLVTAETVDSLLAREFLARSRGAGVDAYWLAPKGRKYAIENGFVRMAPGSSASRHP